MGNTWYNIIFVQPWPFWVGGIFIGLLVPAMYYFLNTPLGVSTGYGSILKLIIPNTKLRWLNTKTFSERFGWRIFFLVGIIAGAFLSARLSGKPMFVMDMGIFTTMAHWPLPLLALWFLCGGLLLGLGSRISGGCTSGHCIHGLANLHLSSLIATVFYVLFGIITVNLIRVFLLGGA